MQTTSFTQYFPQYEIIGELGRGNARVLKVRHRDSGQLRAIKHFAFNTDPDTLRRFQQESEIMIAIQHPHIVKIIDVHLDADLPYVVMELIEGGDLRKHLRAAGVLPVAEILRLAEQLSLALDAIHQRDVVHRDIKPENIMYRRLPSGELQYLLTDFGIAKLREQSNTVTGSSMLTYEYASPEQFTDSRAVHAATDFYSMGVVLYECATGSVPFEYEEGNLLLHINQVISHPVDMFQLPPGFPPTLKKIIQGLLAKRATERLTDSGQLKLMIQAARQEMADAPQAPAPAVTRQTMAAPQRINRYGYETILPTFSAVKGTVQLLMPSRHRSAFFPFFVLLLVMSLALGAYFVWGSFLKKFPVTERFVNSTRDRDSAQNNDTKSIVPVNHNARQVRYPIHPVKDQFFIDDFSSPGNGWIREKDDQKEFAYENGKYVIKGYDSNYTYQSTRYFDIDLNKNWSVAVNMNRRSGNEPDGFGLNYLSDPEKEAYYVFYISADGYYKIEAHQKDDIRALVDWTRTYNIHPENAMNMLSVSKQGSFLSFFINDVKEITLPFEGAFGNGFGLRVDGNQQVAFDQFILRGVR
ncbi:serine/threonine protein kinase [Flavihumibacter petaseus]|uniref:non-specific serine/threonine protein kinase n=1 Tax=Flavihumibacter petaseus NBRC 106054 TaxID=1220578 RepID=A0A0E9MUA6_9BACT|nr:serine/threonine-protein kinase [Flavihumibacter petaseus]GAO41058.1 putative serine/threonine-protein kinase [Flavihumibacter petaseus NBRC 106054]